jgi:hypothetical protein
MRAASFLFALGLVSSPLHAAGESGSEAASAAIREVVAGKTCIGDDVLIFGKSLIGTSGNYERIGRPPGRYQIGEGTILILRGKDLHSHVATVSVPDHMLYMSTGKYRCEP